MKDNEIAKAVNKVTRVAREFGGAQQLRSRVSDVLVPLLKPKTCEYTRGKVDGFSTEWDTECGHEMSCSVPEDVGFQRAPEPNAYGRLYCSWCGGLVELVKPARS